MSERTPAAASAPASTPPSASASAPLPLPEHPSLEWLRKRAKHRLAELRAREPAARLADAQLLVAREHGFPSWRALKAHVDALSLDGQVIEAARAGDVARLAALLDAHPDRLQLRAPPYGFTLLHTAAQHGRLAAVELLLRRGLDANVREQGDDTTPMHWAAAAGHPDVVRRLADAGGDVVGDGDDHGLQVIGWATCWDGCDDDAHRAVVDVLLSRGARHHVFSAVAMNLGDEVRRIVAADPGALGRRLTRSDDHRTPLHFAVLRRRPEMVRLLIELGADPLAVDGSGEPAPMYATTPDVDRALLETVARMTAAELRSAGRGHRAPRGGVLDLVAALALGDHDTAARLLGDDARRLDAGGAYAGALHLLAKRGDADAVAWLLARGADPNARWSHWGAEVTPLHLAAAHGHVAVIRRLLAAGADASVRDSEHDGSALGWAEHFGQVEAVRVLRGA